ncbi:MAG: FG-GAP-like repeat-containing protein [Armatimonadota bacterium]
MKYPILLASILMTTICVFAGEPATYQVEELAGEVEPTALKAATGGTAVTVETGASLHLEVPVQPGLFSIAIAAMSGTDEATKLTIMLEEDTESVHFVPGGQWGTVRVGVQSREVGRAVQMELSAPDAPVMLDTVKVTEVEPSHETLPLTAPGTIVRQTPLVTDGEAAAMVLVPRLEQYQKAAQDFVSAFEEKTGVALPTKSETEATKEDLTGQTCIVFGNIASDPVALRLYARHLIYSDSYYPGPGGHELRTVHDPWGGGSNVVFMGGSDPGGAQQAANALIARIEPGDNIVLPVMIDWQSERTNFNGLTDEQIAQKTKDIHDYLRAFKGAYQYKSACGRPGEVARAYYLSGDPSYAKAYESLVEELASYYEENEPDPPTFTLANIVVGLDQIEECPEFSDDARLKAAEWLRQIVEDSFHYWELRGPIAREEAGIVEPTWNHETHPAVGVAYAVEYFDAHFNMEPVQWWRDVISNLFTGQETAYKPLEDSANYQWITLYHTMQWALISGDMDLFESGTLKKTAELAIACHDNFGDESTFGDAWMPFGSNARLVFKGASLYYGDPRYEWMLNRLEQDRGHYPGGMYWSGPAEEPLDQVGLSTFILDPAVPKKQSAGKVPQEVALDKAVFRSGFDPQDDYLMLDGMSAGIHGHYDANAIIRYTDNGRLWLTDMDYIRSWPKWHNSINISRDGQTTEVPPLAELTAKAGFDGFGMVQSRVPEYAWTDWTRSVFWKAKDFFVVMDELSANDAGEFRTDCQWRTLGEVQIDGGTLTAEQEGEYFHIQNADGSRPMLRTSWDRGHGGDRGYYAKYPHAGRLTKILHQNRTVDIEADETIRYLNLFHTSQDAAARVSASVVDDAVAAIRGPETAMLIGTGPWSQDNARIEAAMFAVSADTVYLADATGVELPGLTLTADNPADVLINVAEGSVTAMDGEVASSSVHAEPLRQWLTGVIEAAQAPPTPPALQPIETAATMGERWSTDLDSDIVCTDIWTQAEREYIAAGTHDGQTVLLDGAGEVLWQQEAEGIVRDVAFADIDGDGTPEVASGADDAKIRLYSITGDLLWEVEIEPYHGRSGSVATVDPADLNGDGTPEIVIGSDNWHRYAFDDQGNELWRKKQSHASTCGDTGDIDDDGKDEILAGTEYYGSSILDDDAGVIGGVRGGPNFTAAAALDVTGDGVAEVLFGSDDAVVQVLDGTGTAIWTHNIGGAVTGFASLGEGVAATSETGYCWIFDSEGNVTATVRLPEQASDVAAFADLAAVACDDGSIYAVDAGGDIALSVRHEGRPGALCSDGDTLIAAWESRLLRLSP